MDATDGGNAHGGRQQAGRPSITTAAVILAACSSGSAGGAGSGHAGQLTRQPPMPIGAGGRRADSGAGDNNTAYRINLPRNDLHITSYGVDIKPLSRYGTRIRPIHNNETLPDGRPRDHREWSCLLSPMRRRHGIALIAQASAAARPAGVVDPHSRAWVMPPDWPRTQGGVDATTIGPAHPTAGTATTGRHRRRRRRPGVGPQGTQDGGLLAHSIPRKDTHHRVRHVLPAVSLKPDDGDFQPVGHS